MIRVVVVDDQQLVRAGLLALLERAGDITVVGEADDGAGGVAMAAAHRPDVVLMDVRMPGCDGIEATRTITSSAATSGVHVVTLTAFDTDEYIFGAIRAGASGFLLKDITPEALRQAVRTVAAGGALLASAVTRRVLDAVGRPGHLADRSRLDPLTERERDVLTEVAAGLTNEQVAEALYLSPATVRTYVSRLFGKLGVARRTQLVVIAYETGLTTPGDRRS